MVSHASLMVQFLIGSIVCWSKCRVSCSVFLCLDWLHDWLRNFFTNRSIACLCVALLPLFYQVVSRWPSLSCLFILLASRQCGSGPKRWLRRCVLSQRNPGPYWSGSSTIDWPPFLFPFLFLRCCRRRRRPVVSVLILPRLSRLDCLSNTHLYVP